jgi:hypothetical protein
VHVQVEGIKLAPEQPRTRRGCTCHLDGEIVLGGGGPYGSAIRREQPSLTPMVSLKPRADSQVRNSSQPEARSKPLRADRAPHGCLQNEQ